MISINKYIRNILIQDLELKSLVNDKIYSVIIPENVSNPVILIEHLSNSRKYVKNNKATDEINVVIYTVADDYVGSIDIAERIDNILDCYVYETEDFKMTFRQNNTGESYIGDPSKSIEYLQRIEYKIIVNYKN